MLKGKLIRLIDSNITFAHLSDDIRGKDIFDRNSNKIGVVDALFIDEKEKKIRLIRAVSDGSMGIGQNISLIPIEAIVRITGNAIYVDFTTQHIKNAPIFEPELIEKDYLENLYGHYGIIPFWQNM
jgi:sporulation protein YlmC with PRC-barrel domain